MKRLWLVIVLAVAGATVATLVATSGDDGSRTRSIERPASTWAPDIAPPGDADDEEKDETPEAEPTETSDSSVRPVSFRPASAPTTDGGGRAPRGSSIDVTEGEFAESSEGEDELEAELEEEEEEAEREEEEDEEKAKRRADRERNHGDDDD